MAIKKNMSESEIQWQSEMKYYTAFMNMHIL